MFMVYSGDDVMTKSIEEQAEEYAYTKVSSKQNHNFHYAEQGYFNGAKARDAQLMQVVNELRSAVHCDYGCKTNQDHGWMVVKCNCDFEGSEVDFAMGAKYQHTKSAAIISELIEIIKSQSEHLKMSQRYLLVNNPKTSVGDRTKLMKVIHSSLSETTTRLQKLREGK